MFDIREIVRDAISTGYLTIEAEDRLRHCLQTKLDRDAIGAFFKLQQCVMEGLVKQQARELLVN
ncbi:MAG: hypothetical protein J7647_14995 [Cyanobacteria bacterium SBLK]|nr:hypothetical protein [Cyanobacteria bacterium SBLK]